MWVCQRAGFLINTAITKNLIIFIPIRLKTELTNPSQWAASLGDGLRSVFMNWTEQGPCCHFAITIPSLEPQFLQHDVWKSIFSPFMGFDDKFINVLWTSIALWVSQWKQYRNTKYCYTTVWSWKFAKCKVQVKSTSALGESRVSWENPAETSDIVTNFLQGNDRILEHTRCTLCLGTLEEKLKQ